MCGGCRISSSAWAMAEKGRGAVDGDERERPAAAMVAAAAAAKAGRVAWRQSGRAMVRRIGS